MAKKIHLRLFKIFGVILCVSSLAGCKPRLNPFTELAVKINYIEYTNLSSPVWKINIDHYIGKYNGYHILMLSSSDEMFFQWIVTEKYDDIIISYGDSNVLRAYKNGDFYRLPELYKKGELSKEDIIKINEIYIEQKKQR